MINRILIRIKVVQLLYSYLLTEKHFALESQPTPPTKEKRFAYRMYIDTLLLMEKISRNIVKNKVRVLAEPNKFMHAVSEDDVIKASRNRYGVSDVDIFAPIVDSLTEKIKESGLYKLYLKDKSKEYSDNGEVKIWREIFNLIIWPDVEYNTIASRAQDYTLRGMDRMKEMMEQTFVNFMASNSGTGDVIRVLSKSLLKARELYFRLLLIPLAITDLRIQQIETNRKKNLPTEEDLNPDMTLADNKLAELLRENVIISNYVENNKIDILRDEHDLIKHFLKKIEESEEYKNYCNHTILPEKEQLERDCYFWRHVMRDMILPDEEFLEHLETQSVFWNDDLDIMGEFAIKTIRRFEDGMGQNSILSMYKDQEDARFGEELINAVLNHKMEYRGLINDNLRSEDWDSERLAFMDVVILLTAIAELLNFPKIPLRATVNEYIEMAKSYSTVKSGVFVNGMLALIIKELKESGKLTKEL